MIAPALEILSYFYFMGTAKINKERRSHSCPVLIRLRVKEEMVKRNLTTAELAEIAKISRNTVARMCNNPIQKQFDNQTIAAIAWALKLPYPGILLEFQTKDYLLTDHK